jgi:His/Glu/Gln/Arg/opine family amino acid ABC transporter permease subunit
MLELSPALSEYSELFFEGFRNTLILAIGGMFGALVIGVFGASLRVWGGPYLSPIGTAYVEFFRNTPLLVQLSFAAVMFAPRNLNITANPIVVGILGLAIYTGSYVTEAVRSGILSVDPRQVESARSLGMSQVATLRFVVLPQAIRTVIPPLGNITIALTKNTAIVSAIAANELLKVAGIIETRTASFDGYLAALVAFWCLTLPLAFVVSRLERRFKFAR